jgi:hypothetical protein
MLAGYEPSRIRAAAAVAFKRADAEPKQEPLAWRRFEYNGRSMTLAEWAKEYGLKANTLHYRIKRGWSIERALTEPLRRALPSSSARREGECVPIPSAPSECA